MPPKPSDNSPPGTGSSNESMTRSIPLRTEEEQAAAAARARQRDEVLASRAERRKSLGNRRVSFATEATLHTFVIDDYPATPSSAGGQSRESTPGQSGERRRSGTQTPKKSNSPSSSGSSSSEDESEPFLRSPNVADSLGRLVDLGEEENADSDSSSSHDGEGSRTFEDTLGRREVRSGRRKEPDPFPKISPISFDEDEEIAMDLLKDEGSATSAKGIMKNFFKKPIRVIHGDNEQKNVAPERKGPESAQLLKQHPLEEVEADVTMDMTRPIGGLLPRAPPPHSSDHGEKAMDKMKPEGVLMMNEPLESPITESPMSGLFSSMRSAAMQLQKHFQPSLLFGSANKDIALNDGGGDATMDMTKPIGGLLQVGPVSPSSLPPSQDGGDGDLTMDMDMTRPVGGLLSSAQLELQSESSLVGYPSLPNSRLDVDDGDGDVTMEMTRPLGRILGGEKHIQSQLQVQEADFDEGAQTMDLTVAVGGIKDGTKAPDMWSTDEEDEKMIEEETMELTAVIGGGVVKNTEPSDEELVGTRMGRRGSTISAPVLISAEEWEREQEAETQLQKELIANQRLDEMAPIVVLADKVEEKGDVDLFVAQDADSIVEMESEEEKDMEFTAIIPSQIQFLQKGPVKMSKAKESSPNTEAVPKVVNTLPNTDSHATPVDMFYGSINRKQPDETSCPFPNPDEEWIPPLRRSKFGKGRLASRNNTPTNDVSPAMNVSRPVWAAVGSPAKLKKQAKMDSTLRSNSPKNRVTRSSTQKRRVGADVPEPQAGAKNVSSDVQDTKLSTPTAGVTTTPTATETPTRSAISKDGSSASARRPFVAPSNPSTPNASKPKRRLSGIGIDKPGLGSPALVASLQHRRSIGENSPFRIDAITPHAVLLESLRAAAEVKMEEKRKSDESFVEKKKRLEKAIDETLDLRVRIENMTPRKVVVEERGKGKRKSDQLEDSMMEVENNVRRDLFGEVQREDKRSSKRRSLGLDKPLVVGPEEKNGRRTRSRTSLDRARASEKAKFTKSVLVSPTKIQETTAPSDKEEAEASPHITLKAFLDMTGVSFLDYITLTNSVIGTRRMRRICGPSALLRKRSKEGTALQPHETTVIDIDEDREPVLGDWIVAGAATVEIYALFWSSCNELKNYIAEGRVEMGFVEKRINADNPKLFREYIAAPGDVKLIMQNQFKSIKTHSRLLAKKDWYSWRTQQLLNLNNKLNENLQTLKRDEDVIEEQRKVLVDTLPSALKVRIELKRRLEGLVERRREVESCDPAELAKARKRLIELRVEVEQKRLERELKRKELGALEQGIEERKERISWVKEEIERVEKLREVNRGFGEEEVWALRSRVRRLEKKYGWSILAVDSGTIMSMSYKDELLLVFNTARIGKSVQPPSVQFIGHSQEKDSLSRYSTVPTASTPRLVGQAYFVEILKRKLATMACPTLADLVRFVGHFWDAALVIIAQIDKVENRWITGCAYEHMSREDKMHLTVTVKVVLPEHKARVNVQFQVDGDKIPVNSNVEDEEKRYADVVHISARVVYNNGGKRATEAAMKGELSGNMMGVSVMGEAGWGDAVQDVVARCFIGEVQGHGHSDTHGQARRRKLQPLQEQTLEQQQILSAKIRNTPKKVYRVEKTPGKKIPVRKVGYGDGEGGKAMEEKPVTRAAAKQSGIPVVKTSVREKGRDNDGDAVAFANVVNPFGTGKRGIPVPTKGAHEAG